LTGICFSSLVFHFVLKINPRLLSFGRHLQDKRGSNIDGKRKRAKLRKIRKTRENSSLRLSIRRPAVARYTHTADHRYRGLWERWAVDMIWFLNCISYENDRPRDGPSFS
jgi:hypothetical protein